MGWLKYTENGDEKDRCVLERMPKQLSNHNLDTFFLEGKKRKVCRFCTFDPLSSRFSQAFDSLRLEH
jgi:hypothetical protein